MTDAGRKFLKAKTDTAQVFLTFMALVGDVAKTATALDLDPDFVQWLADSEGWTAKIKRVNIMSKSEKPGDFERAVNRAMVFVQAHQMRGLIDGVMRELRKMPVEELMDKCSSVDRLGNLHFSGKLFTDLTTAIEACSRVSFVALGDTVTERVERDEAASTGGLPASALHTAIIAALSNPALGAKTSDALVREQVHSVFGAKSSEDLARERAANVKLLAVDSEIDRLVKEQSEKAEGGQNHFSSDGEKVFEI